METKTTISTEVPVNPEAVERVEKKPWPFRSVEVDVTPDMVKTYFENTPAAVSVLLDELLLKVPWTLENILEKHWDDFTDYVLGSYEG